MSFGSVPAGKPLLLLYAVSALGGSAGLSVLVSEEQKLQRRDCKNARKVLQGNGMCHETQGGLSRVKYPFPLCLVVYLSSSVLLSIFY